MNKYYPIKWNLDMRENPEEYVIGRGEFGVLMYLPYKNEILPFWKYKDEKSAKKSSQHIYQMFLDYLKEKDYNGADMARKFLQMGFTRSMRYAKYKGGKKYKNTNKKETFPAITQENGWYDPEKRKAALIFKKYWDMARQNETYKKFVESKK